MTKNPVVNEPKMHKKRKVEGMDITAVIIISLFAMLIILPFWSSVMISLTTESDYMRNKFVLWPATFTFESYKTLFTGKSIFIGYSNTLYHIAFGLPISMFLTISMGYVLSRPHFPGKKIFTTFVMITMLFGGGMIPTFLLVKELGLINNRWAVILTNLLSTYNCILMSSYIRTLPASLFESARLDGAGESKILFSIVLPLSLPIIATLSLFYLVGKWNEWWSSMMYLNKNNLMPLQMVLRNLIESAQVLAEQGFESLSQTQAEKAFTMGMKMAAIVVTMLPVMLVFPFLQKYFMKGITIGAVKE